MSYKGKPCGMCGGKKGPNYASRKYCGNCVRIASKAASERAHRQRVAVTYGLEDGDYEAIYAGQEGRCAICWRATGQTRRLSVDHDHRTGLVRGLVCRPCNGILGHARDDPNMFIRAADYLREPPAPRILTRLGRGIPRVPSVSAALTGGC